MKAFTSNWQRLHAATVAARKRGDKRMRVKLKLRERWVRFRLSTDLATALLQATDTK